MSGQMQGNMMGGMNNMQMGMMGKMMGNMNNMDMEPPSKEKMMRMFSFGVCCETCMNSIMPIFYGLYLFDVMSKKAESGPNYDCYANAEDNIPVAGI